MWSARESGPRCLASRSELVRAADELGCRLAGVASVGGTRERLERALTTAAAHEVQLLTRERGVRRARSERLSIRPACAGGREVRSGVWTDLLAFSVVTVCRLSGEDRAIVSSTTGMPRASRVAAVTVRFDRVQNTGRRASTRARKAALSPETTSSSRKKSC